MEEARVIEKGRTLPRLVRALILILLGVLAFVLGSRLLTSGNAPSLTAPAGQKCSGCPLAEKCAGAAEGAQEK